MAFVSRNFTLTSYTNNVWTDVITTNVNLHTVLVANTTGGAIDVSIRIGGPNAVVLPTTSVEANTAYTLDLRGITILTNQTLQVMCSATGINVIASEAF